MRYCNMVRPPGAAFLSVVLLMLFVAVSAGAARPSHFASQSAVKVEKERAVDGIATDVCIIKHSMEATAAKAYTQQAKSSGVANASAPPFINKVSPQSTAASKVWWRDWSEINN